MFERLKPLTNLVLVKTIQEEQKTSGGIFLPTSTMEKTQTGSVLAVGPGKRDSEGVYIPMEVQVGDIVYFNKNACTEDDNGHIIIREDNILGIVESV